jgi:dipeptidyl aminopeptidase/acylaminoacyl peptidase
MSFAVRCTVVALLAVLGLALGLAAATAQATLAGGNGRLAVAPLADASGIATMRADGSDSTMLIDQGQTPKWSPDGTKIAFDKEERGDGLTSELWVMGVDGSNPTRLASGWGLPDWSPDGTRIAFTVLEHLPPPLSYISRPTI